jgi:Coenzyme PQQ synthesis protein D (PqqD)
MNQTTVIYPFRSDTRVVASKDIIFAELGDEVSLLNTKTGVYYTLNAVAATVWKGIHEATVFSEIKEHLISEYEVVDERCETDLMRLVERLHREGLIEIVA